MITPQEARLAAQTLEDVFAPDDDGDMMSGVVASPVSYRVIDRERVPGVRLDGCYHPMRWVPLVDIELSRTRPGR